MVEHEKMSASGEKTSYPTIGFLPQYLPNGSLNANPSSSTNVTHPLSLNPIIEIKIDSSPTWTDELSKKQYPSFNSGNFSTIPNCSENSGKIKATAPSIHEIDYKTGMTISERNDILNEFTTLINSKCKIEEFEFQTAKKKIINLLSNAESRLTTTEKNDFIRRLNDIIRERQTWLKTTNERLKKKKPINNNKQNVNAGDSLDIMTLFQLIAIIVHILLLYFCLLYEDKISNGFLRVFAIFALFGLLFIIMIQVLCSANSFYYALDILFSLMSSIFYSSILQPMTELALIKIVMYLLGIIFIMQIIVKSYMILLDEYIAASEEPQKRTSSHKKNHTSVKYTRPSKNFNPFSLQRKSHTFKNNYHLSPYRVNDLSPYRKPRLYDTNDISLHYEVDHQDDNDYTYEDNNQADNGDNEVNNSCNEIDYSYNYEDVCGGNDYSNDNDAGDCGGQDCGGCDD